MVNFHGKYFGKYDQARWISVDSLFPLIHQILQHHKCINHIKSLFFSFMGESTNLSWWTPDSEPSTVDSLSPFQVTGAKRSHSVWICVANSRVGAKTKVMGVGVSGAVAVFSHLRGHSTNHETFTWTCLCFNQMQSLLKQKHVTSTTLQQIEVWHNYSISRLQ